MSLAKEGMRSLESQLDSKLKALKNKSKRYDTVLKCAIYSLRKIAMDLASVQVSTQETPSKTMTGNLRKDEPLQVNELQKNAAYYKDSVEILGLGLNELESFINPQKGIKPYLSKSNKTSTE